MTKASRCVYTLIHPLTGPANNHQQENGLSHLQIMEHPNVHIISLQLVIHYLTCEHWFIATEPYDRIPTATNSPYSITQQGFYSVFYLPKPVALTRPENSVFPTILTLVGFRKRNNESPKVSISLAQGHVHVTHKEDQIHSLVAMDFLDHNRCP